MDPTGVFIVYDYFFTFFIHEDTDMRAGGAAGGGDHKGPAEASCGAGTANGRRAAAHGAPTPEEESRSSSRLHKICGE